MKKILALILALAMLFTLAACGGEEEAETTAKTEAGNNDAGSTEITGETYNAGNFTALVPAGWMAIPVTDMWSDDGAVDPDALQIIKDGTSEFDILTKAYIQFDYYAPETDLMVPSSEWYDGAENLDPIVAGEYTWNGFTAVSGGNTMITLWTGEAGGPQFQATLWCNGENVISASDADVLAILASVVPAA